MIDKAISKLAAYALHTSLIEESEYTWAVNTILDTLKLDSYTDPGQEWGDIELASVLEELLNDAYARGVLTENSVVYRNLFDTELMGRLTPRPAQVIEKFQTLCAQSPEAATDWYYKFSQYQKYKPTFRNMLDTWDCSINWAFFQSVWCDFDKVRVTGLMVIIFRFSFWA